MSLFLRQLSAKGSESRHGVVRITPLKPTRSFTATTTMAGVSTTVLYPNTPGKTFDINYYLHKHMPYAEKIWGPLGMKDWKMTAFQNAPDGTQAPYRYKVVSRWTSLDDMKNATTTSIGKPVLEDVANFTNEEPIILVGEDLASSE